MTKKASPPNFPPRGSMRSSLGQDIRTLIENYRIVLRVERWGNSEKIEIEFEERKEEKEHD